MLEVRLRFINNSQATNNPTIAVSCMDNTAEQIIAWRLIRNIGPGSFYPFVYTVASEISVADSNGNITPKQAAEPGDLFTMVNAGSGNQLQRQSGGVPMPAVGVRNALQADRISAYIFKDGHVCTQMSIWPGAQARFSLTPEIFIGKVASMQQGPMFTTIEFDGVPTEVSLLGFRSADIVMTGDDSQLAFTLDNVH